MDDLFIFLIIKVITKNKSPEGGVIASGYLFYEPAYGSAVARITMRSHNTFCPVDPPSCVYWTLSYSKT